MEYLFTTLSMFRTYWDTSNLGVLWGEDGQPVNNIVKGTDGQPVNNIVKGTDGQTVNNIVKGTDGQTVNNIVKGTDGQPVYRNYRRMLDLGAHLCTLMISGWKAFKIIYEFNHSYIQ